jgi:hypothetical protein
MIKISIIIPTEAKLEDSEKVGLLSRWKFYFAELSKYFNLEVFSCDKKDYSEILGVKHITLPLSLKFIPYGNQILYNFWLMADFLECQKVITIVYKVYVLIDINDIMEKTIKL